MTDPAPQSPLDAFRALVLGDAALQASLARVTDPQAFIVQAAAAAEGRGLDVPAEALSEALKPDPLGLARLDGPAPLHPDWPPAGWLPTSLSGGVVEWAHFGGETLHRPFFAEDARAALARPFNRLLRYGMRLEDFVRAAPESGAVPEGLIFHMSRCGSTLVARMLAAMDGTVVLSEPPPLDALLQLAVQGRVAEPEAAVRAMAAALGRAPPRLFLKLNFWHILALPLLLRAFPGVPWLFLRREPAAVIASQMRVRGPETVPALMPLLGLDTRPGEPPEEECARALALICEAAAAQKGAGRSLFVDHEALPGAVAGAILPHFGVAASSVDLAAMAEAAARDSKRPGQAYAGDEAPSEAARAAAARYLAALRVAERAS